MDLKQITLNEDGIKRKIKKNQTTHLNPLGQQTLEEMYDKGELEKPDIISPVKRNSKKQLKVGLSSHILSPGDGSKEIRLTNSEIIVEAPILVQPF